LRRAAVVIADVGSQAGADRALAQVLPLLPADTTVVVLSPSPGSKPVPVVFWGAGVSHGRLELSGGVRLRPLTLPDVTATLMGLTGTRPSSSGTGRALGVTPVAAGGDHGLPAAFGRSAHVAGAGPSADGVVAPVVAGFLGLLGLGAAVWLVRERGWPEAPDPRRRPRVAPAMVSRWLAAGAVVAFSLPALVLAQAALAEGASAGGPPTVAGLLGLGLVAVVRALARRGMVRGVRSTVQAGGWALLAAGSLALALVPEAGRWAVVAPRSPLLGGLAGAGPAVTAAVLGGALLAAAAAGGALGRAVPLLAAGAVLAVPVLGDDPVAAGIAFLAAGIALAGHLGPGRSARRLPALVGGLAAGALAAAPALLRPGTPATLARSLGADVFGWRSPWLPAAVVGLGAAVAVATVVIPGGPGAGATKTRHEGESGAAGGERAVGWGLLLACFLAVGLHPDGMPTAALLFTQLAAVAVLIALRAGEPEPALSEPQTSEARLRPAPVTASRA